MLLAVRLHRFFLTFCVGVVRQSETRQRAGEQELRELIREQSDSVN
jgi:hypothetical protein